MEDDGLLIYIYIYMYVFIFVHTQYNESVALSDGIIKSHPSFANSAMNLPGISNVRKYLYMHIYIYVYILAVTHMP